MIAMLSGKMKIIHLLICISRYVFTVEIDFPELVFGIVIAVFGGYYKTADGFLNIFDLVLGQINFA